MPLVDPLPEDHNPDLVDLIQFFRGPLGTVPNSVLTMQRRPAMARAFTELNKAVMANHARVTAEQKRLIGYMASHTAGCHYCEAHTILAAERFGATPERLADIWSYETSPHFTEAERAEQRAAGQVRHACRHPSPHSSGSFRRRRCRWAPAWCPWNRSSG